MAVSTDVVSPPKVDRLWEKKGERREKKGKEGKRREKKGEEGREKEEEEGRRKEEEECHFSNMLHTY